MADSDSFVDLPCACAEARRMARVLTQLYDSHLRSAQIEASQFALLMFLQRVPGGNQRAMGRMMGFDKTTLSRNLKRLEQKGWIEASVGKNRKERSFVLTDSGQERLRAAMPAWTKAQEKLRAAMEEKGWSAMFETFRKLTAAASTARK